MSADLPLLGSDRDYDTCPKCGAQAFLVADDWSEPGIEWYFYECKDDECGWQSRQITGKEYWTKFHPYEDGALPDWVKAKYPD